MPARLDLSARAASQHPVAESSISWGGALPSLPTEIRDLVQSEFGLTLEHDPAAPDPLTRPAFAAVYARTRAEQVVLALSARTNLVLAGTTAAIAGEGVLSDELSRTLSRVGARVIRLADDPVVRLRAHLAGLETAPTAHRRSTAHYLIVTGEHTPLAGDGGGAAGGAVLVDATPAGGAIATSGEPPLRSHVNPTAAGAPAVEIPAPFPVGEGSGLQWRIADALIALSILTAAAVDDVDATLAELVLA